MSSELTNLLPSERIHAFRRGYFFRLGATIAVMLAGVIVVHGVLLIPTYLYIQESATLARAHLAELEAGSLSSGEGEIQARTKQVESEAERALALLASPSATTILQTVLEAPRTGVTIKGFSFHAPSPEGRLTITGVAETRESLRQYQLALSKLSFAKSAELPLSAYTKERDIPFVITLIGSFTP